LAALAFLTALAGLLDAVAFLAEAAFASFLAATRARDAVAASEVFRFRFEGFATTFFIFARMVLRAVRAFAANLPLAARFRIPDEDVSFETRFDAGFALEAGLVFFVFDFVVFFDLLRAAIVKLSTRDRWHIRLSPCANTALQNSERTLCEIATLYPRRLWTSAPRLISRLAQNRRKIKEEDDAGRLATVAFG
jgi:hypothetical protein